MLSILIVCSYCCLQCVFVLVSFIHQNKGNIQDDCMQTSEITNDGGNRDVLRRLIRIGH